MLNRLTTENTLAATKEIFHGIRVSTDWSLDQPKAPCFNRAKFEHKIIHKHPRTVNDDELSLNTQSSSQWDGFRHFGKSSGHLCSTVLTRVIQDIKITSRTIMAAHKMRSTILIETVPMVRPMPLLAIFILINCLQFG